MMTKKVSVLIAEDQDITRLGLKLALGKIEGIDIVGEAADGQEVVNQAQQLHPNIVLMDIGLPVIDGIEATQRIKAELPQTRIIMFTSDETDDTIFKALRAGADGYCLKKISADQLSIAINSVMLGAAWLDPGVANRVLRSQPAVPPPQPVTQSEAPAPAPDRNIHVEVLKLIERGLTKEQISQKLQLPVSTVEKCLREILGGVLSGGTGGAASPQPAPGGNAPHLSMGGASVDISQPAGDATVMSDSKALRPGMIFAGKYLIKDAIGSGGMSIVYDAQHEYMERRVAIKMLHERLVSDDELLKRFRQEAKVTSSVTHPNMVTIYDSGVTESGQPYIVMDFLDGMSLQEYIEKGQPETEELIAVFCQVCDALDAAHKRGLIHRDMKPSNIMLVPDEHGNAFVKLVDFGIAKFVHDQQHDTRLTQTGQVFGTPSFMSPEQCKSEELDARSDIYSLGCVMYESFTGQRAFVGSSVYDVLTKQVGEMPSREPFNSPNSLLLSGLEGVIFKCMEKDPAKRWQSVAEVKDALLDAYRRYQK